MPLIASQDRLDAFCASVRLSEFLALDTEFIREKTYYPQLCLIQAATPEHAVCIDPLAGLDLAPLLDILYDERVMKVMHASRQDMEIFYHLAGRLPAPLFDTQVAAMVCGYSESIAYSALVHDVLKVHIDKASRFTDWAHRPLSPRQIEYALADVTHLCGVYAKLREHLETRGRASWIAEELEALQDIELYRTHPGEAWRKLKAGTMRPRHLAVLRQLAQWREMEAQRRDVPRGRVLRDEVLLEIAASAPQSMEELKRIRGLDRHAGGKAMETLLGLVETALALPSDQWPQTGSRRQGPSADECVVEILQLVLRLQCREHGVAPRLVATREDLENIAMGDRQARALHGWRREIFGRYAEALMRGGLSIGLDGDQKPLMKMGAQAIPG